MKDKMTERYKIEKLDINKVIEKNKEQKKMEEIIKIIEREPSLLEKLDIRKLEIIEKYYKYKLLEYKNKLTKRNY